jgi:hypothetical protein
VAAKAARKCRRSGINQNEKSAAQSGVMNGEMRGENNGVSYVKKAIESRKKAKYRWRKSMKRR